MKYLAHISSCIASFLLWVPVWAHGDAEELGHHWESRAYITEMRFQFVLMAILTVIIVAANAIGRVRRKRGASQ